MDFIHFFFLILLIGGAKAFVYSCNEVKNKLINQDLEVDARFVCLIPQENFTNDAVLGKIYAQSGNKTTSFSALLRNCVQRKGDGPWQIVADLPVTLDCTQEFSLIFTSSTPQIFIATNKAMPLNSAPEWIIARPQTGIRISTNKCTGDGNVTISTGAGRDIVEDRFEMASWGCTDIPAWIVSFDSVITITIDNGVNLKAVASSHDYSSEVEVSEFQRMAVMSSGRSDDVQLLDKYANSVTFAINNGVSTEMSVKCNSYFEGNNCITLHTESLYSDHSQNQTIGNGDYSWSDFASQYQLDYKSTPVAPEDLWNSQDNFVCEFTLGASTHSEVTTSPMAHEASTTATRRTMVTSPTPSRSTRSSTASPAVITSMSTVAPSTTSASDVFGCFTSFFMFVFAICFW